MPMRALGPAGSMEAFMVDFGVEALATIISSRPRGLGISTTSSPIFMGVYTSMPPRYGSPPNPTLA